jgi:translation elongation factor EF-Ts
LDAVNWIGLAVKKIKAETVKKCRAKAGFGESDVAYNLEEASENIATALPIFTHRQICTM